MFKLQLLLLVAAVYCQGPANKGDMKDLLDSIFGPSTGNTATTGNTGNTGNVNRQTTATPLENKNQGATGASTIVPFNTNEVESLECELTDGRKGECVKYYLCNMANNTIIRDGAGVIDIRVNDGVCDSYIDVCCDVGQKRPTTDPIKPIKPDRPERVGCGWRNPEGADFQTTGDVDGETKFGEFPWACALLKIAPVNDNEPDGQKLHVYVGGGSLIHPNVVLTAAHYVAKEQSLHVRAGEWDTQTIKEIYPFQDRDVESIVVHEDFNTGNLFYDVALLFLSQPMDLAPNVGVVCLPPPRVQTPAGTNCFATGWGKDKFGKEGRYQVILKKVEVPVVGHKECQQKLRQTRLGKYFELHSSFMCAGGVEGVDACRGDGGAPLSCPIQSEPGRYVQSGIVAWGIGCAMQGVPGVYVDVANLREWIDDKVVGKAYDHKVYSY